MNQKNDIAELEIKNILCPNQLVYVMCDFITHFPENEKIKSKVSNIYKGQVGIVNLQMSKVKNPDQEHLLKSNSLLSSTNLIKNKEYKNIADIYISISFLDPKQGI